MQRRTLSIRNELKRNRGFETELMIIEWSSVSIRNPRARSRPRCQLPDGASSITE